MNFKRILIGISLILTTAVLPAFAAICLPSCKQTFDCWRVPDCCNFLKCTKVGAELDVAGFTSNRTPTTMGTVPDVIGTPPANDVDIFLATIFSDTQFTNWSKLFLQATYAQTSPSFVYSPPGLGNVFFIDKAYLTLGDPRCTPFYFQFGRQFLNFGGLDFSSMLESTTQLLSLYRATTATIGFNNVLGFNAAAYLFRGSVNQVDHKNTTLANEYGFSLDFKNSTRCTDFQIGAGYLSNIAGTLYNATTFANNSNLGNLNAYVHKVPGLDLHASFKVCAFDASVRYIDALKAFDVNDVPFTTDNGATLIGAQPAAWGVNAGYTFPIFCHSTRFGLGYQGSSEATAIGTAAGSVAETISGVYGPYFAIGLPKTRYYANYNISLAKCFNMILEVAEEKSYGISNAGTGRNGVIGVLMFIAKLG